MDRWMGKTAIVTGASSGIGAAIVVDLVKAGVNVVGLARRKERVEALQELVPATSSGKIYAIQCDLSRESEIASAFEWVESNLGGVDILVNNAGILKTMHLVDADNSKELREVVDINIMAVAICSREAFQSMKKRNVDGHIININSIVGHSVPYLHMIPTNIYPATKHAMTAMTATLRQEFQTFGTKIKVTSVSPGAVKTEIFSPSNLEQMQNFGFLESEDVSQAVIYALATEPHVEVHELIIQSVGASV